MTDLPTAATWQALHTRFETALFEQVLPFWTRHSPDRTHGGYFNHLDRDGTVYDTTKQVWLQGRQAWMFSKLYRTVEPRPAWLDLARLGIDFLRAHARRPDGRVYFALTADGRPVYLQRKIFSECFYTMALAEYARAADEPALLREAEEELALIWDWAFDWTKVGRPAFEGAPEARSLAVPMILLNLIEEVAGDDWARFAPEIDECIRRLLMHVHPETQTVREHVAPDGGLLDGPMGRLLNPGHAIEAGWFLQHWARRLGRADLQEQARTIVRWSYRRGWDETHGGLFYFLDADGYSPTPLEWFMKLWWPHCEALYAHLLNYHLTGDPADWNAFRQVETYTFTHFPDPEHGEWYGYLDREGQPTHRFKGGPYKGCFHVPRALYLCWRLASERIRDAQDS
ncbi:MAG: N-acylglucosamine 2-epimerase [Bacteroidetes bacterium]|nr:MAG: N-acylglucosamine 2-epimerase [Bacteroidota bacterium]